MNHSFYPRVAITNKLGNHVRYVPGALAGAMALDGAALPVGMGKCREVTLVRIASTHAQRIGEPSTPGLGGVRFVRWQRLDSSASRVMEHHPRCLYV